jgi:hypothetical protein
MRFIRVKRWLWLWLVVTAVLLTAGLAWAGGSMITRSLISSGGGQVSQSSFTLHSAVGQPAIGTVANSAILCSGYLCDAAAPPITIGNQNIYLPYLKR